MLTETYSSKVHRESIVAFPRQPWPCGLVKSETQLLKSETQLLKSET